MTKIIKIPLTVQQTKKIAITDLKIQQKSDIFQQVMAYITKLKGFVLCGQAADNNILNIFSDRAANRIITFANNNVIHHLRYETAVGLTICDEKFPIDDLIKYQNISNYVLNLLEKHDTNKLPSINEQLDVLQAGNETARFWYEKSVMHENVNAWFSAAHPHNEGVGYRYFGKTLRLKNKKGEYKLKNCSFWTLKNPKNLLISKINDVDLVIKSVTANKLLRYSVCKTLINSPIHLIK